MMYIIDFLAILVLYSFVDSWVSNRRQVLLIEMNIIYSKMQTYTYQNNLYNDKAVFLYLLPFKYFVENTCFTDIKTLLSIFLKQADKDVEKSESKSESVAITVPEELKQMGKKFDQNLGRAVKLSSFRVEFILFFFIQFIKAIPKAIFNRSITTIRTLFRAVRAALNMRMF